VATGDLKTYVNVAGVFVGAGTNNKMVDAEFLIEPGNWYINFGSPDQEKRGGVNMQVGGATLATLSSYMCIGKGIPPMPSLPAEVQSITGLNNIMNSESARASGRGFAFGAALTVGDDSDICFPNCNSNLYFYAKLRAELGFDLMLQDYGDATCANYSGSALGINGWYASGQAYMLLTSKVGIAVKLFGVQRKFDVLDIHAAAAIQAKLPNPFLGRGAVKGKVNVLGGLVKMSFSLPFRFGGDACELTGGGTAGSGYEIISSLDPTDGADFVDVAAHPSVVFNVPIGENFTLTDENGLENTYKATLVYAKLTRHGYELPVQQVWNESHTTLELLPSYMMASNDSFTLEVKVKVSAGNIASTEEVKSSTFRTGKGYVEIPDFNVRAAYPADGQYNFYRNEWNQQKGYVLLHANQSELLQEQGLIARISHGNQKFDKPVNYSFFDRRLEFSLPAASLQGQTLYKLEILIPSVAHQEGGAASSLTAGTGNDAAKLMAGEDEISTAGERVVHTAYFRTSQYATFSAKIADFTPTIEQNSIGEDYGSFKVAVEGEYFDASEMDLTNLALTADLDNTTWFQDIIRPRIYQKYAGQQPSSECNVWVDERPSEPYGRVPYKAVEIEGDPAAVTVTAADYEAGYMPAPTAQYIQYVVPKVVELDWFDVCYDVQNYYHDLLWNNPNDSRCMAYSCCFYSGGETQYDCCCYYIPGNTNEIDINCGSFQNAEDYRDDWVMRKVPTLALQEMYLHNPSVPLTPPAGNYKVYLKYTLPGLNATTTTAPLLLRKM
jgi:hypothetical protein